MITRAFPVLAILFATTAARADIGVVVTGEATLQPQLASQFEGWLKQRGHTVFSSVLEPDAINTLIDCFVVEDLNCARTLVERRAKADTVIFTRVEMNADQSDGSREISLSGYWMQKGHQTIAERRICHHCNEASFRTTADDLISALLQEPAVGTSHHVPEPKEVADARAAGDMASPPPETEAPTSRLVPGIVIGAGVALVITGAVLYAVDGDQSPPTGPQEPGYHDTATAGIVFGAAGVAAIGVGAYLWLTQSSSSSAPVAAVTHDGAVLGWSGRF